MGVPSSAIKQWLNGLKWNGAFSWEYEFVFGLVDLGKEAVGHL